MKEFKISTVSIGEAWCLKNIGPRLYYLHNKIGGVGWRIVRNNNKVSLSIDDDKKALLAILTLSGQ